MDAIGCVFAPSSARHSFRHNARAAKLCPAMKAAAVDGGTTHSTHGSELSQSESLPKSKKQAKE